MFVGILAFVVGDIVSTRMALDMPYINEGNPAVIYLLETGGFELFITVKVLIVIGILIADYILFVSLDDFKNHSNSIFGTVVYYVSSIAPISMMLGWGVLATVSNFYLYYRVSVIEQIDPHGIMPVLELIFFFV